MVDAGDSKSPVGNNVSVRIRPPVPVFSYTCIRAEAVVRYPFGTRRIRAPGLHVPRRTELRGESLSTTPSLNIHLILDAACIISVFSNAYIKIH